MSIWNKMSAQQKVLIFALCLYIVGLFFSRALLSISTVLLIVNAVFTPNLKENTKRFFQNRAALLLSSLFFLTVFSGLFSENTTTWLEWVRIKVSYLILPFSIVSISPISKRQFYGLLYWFFIISVIAAVGVYGNYLIHYEYYTDRYNLGGSMQTPIIYVRFSLFLAFAIVIGGFLWWKNFVLKFKWERYFIAFSTLFLFIFIHILAVRTGLFALYNTLFASICFYIYKQKKLGLSLAAITAIILIPIFAYNVVPSLQNKIAYMRYDLSMYFKKDSNIITSDYMRLISIETGIRVAKENGWLFGCGIGDLRDEMYAIYEKEYPSIEKKLLPHNQYIFILASMGILGLLVFIFVTFYPLFGNKHYKFWFFVCFHIVTFSSFLAETTIELQIGNSYYLMFVLIGSNYLAGPEGKKELQNA